MQRHPVLGLLVLAVLGASETAFAPRAAAIPAFARRYQMSCTTCHAPFPRLKPYGEEFAGRGFRLEDASQEPARATYDTGDPLLKLYRDLPLAVRLDGWASFNEDAPAEVDFEFPWVVKLLSGGPITDKISYYVYGIFEDGEAIKLEDTYVQFNTLFGAPVDLMVGQFQVSDPMFKRELRLTRNDYAIYKTSIGLVPTDLTYDRGFVLSVHAPGEVDVVAEAVNGNGIGPVEDGFDDGSFKNFAGRIMRPFGPVRAGVFGYYGKQKLVSVPPDITDPLVQAGRQSEFWYWGPDLVLDLHPKCQLNLQYLERRDSDPFFTGSSGDDLLTRGGFAELQFLPAGQDGRWVLTGLYNRVDSDDERAAVENASLTVNRLVARNFRLVGEGAYDLETERTRASVGFVTAF